MYRHKMLAAPVKQYAVYQVWGDLRQSQLILSLKCVMNRDFSHKIAQSTAFTLFYNHVSAVSNISAHAL